MCGSYPSPIMCAFAVLCTCEYIHTPTQNTRWQHLRSINYSSSIKDKLELGVKPPSNFKIHTQSLPKSSRKIKWYFWNEKNCLELHITVYQKDLWFPCKQYSLCLIVAKRRDNTGYSWSRRKRHGIGVRFSGLANEKPNEEHQCTLSANQLTNSGPLHSNSAELHHFFLHPSISLFRIALP